jgi:histo-blood group ABO system transferase
MNSEIKTALLVIATGEKYRQYAAQLIESAKKYFVVCDILLWTDTTFMSGATRTFIKEPLGFPQETLQRYSTFLTQREILQGYKHLYYVDSDMLFVSPIREEDIFSDAITGVFHPGYLGKCGTPERNPASTAYIPVGTQNKYFCGGFNGGKTESFLAMAETIKHAIDIDTQNGVMAVWHDESHLNRYLLDNPPARILGPEYCYPEGCERNYVGHMLGEPKLIALTKT